MCFLLGLRIGRGHEKEKRRIVHLIGLTQYTSVWLGNYEYYRYSDGLTHADKQKWITCSPYPSAEFHMLICWQ